MALCEKCGAQVEDGKTCQSCGEQVETTAKLAPEEEKNDVVAKICELNNTADITVDFEKDDIEQNRIMGVLAYLSWLVLIPIFAAPKSKFARFHANQGLVLAIAEVIYGIATAIVNAIITAISLTLGLLVSTILSLIGIVFFIMTIIGIVNAVNGKAKELPTIGKFKILK